MPWLENSGKAVKVLLRKISKDGQELECGKGKKEFQAKKKKKSTVKKEHGSFDKLRYEGKE